MVGSPRPLPTSVADRAWRTNTGAVNFPLGIS